jgi:hypothetical protein
MEQAIQRGKLAAAELSQTLQIGNVAELPTIEQVLADFASNVGL